MEIRILDFYTQVYPDSIVEECLLAVSLGLSIKPPRCIFLPSKDMYKIMIQANLKYSKKDNLQTFLLRFGLIENPNWYLKKFC